MTTIGNLDLFVNVNNDFYRLGELYKPKQPDINKYHMDIKGHIDIIEKQKGDRIICGYANVAVVDKQEQLIPIETLKKGIQTLLEDPHYANLMLVHKNIQIGKIIERYGLVKTRVDDKGLFIVCQIREDTETANEVWNSILDGEYGGFSIGCEVLVSHEQCDDEKCITILDEINIFEVSICSSPVNQASGFVVISKSDYEKIGDTVCVECENINNGSMTKKPSSKDKTEEKVVEEKTEETKPEETVEAKEEFKEEPKEEVKEEEKTDPLLEKMEELERKINALEGLLQESTKEECVEEVKTEEEPKQEVKQDEEEEEEEEQEDETKKKGAPWGSMDPANQKPVPVPTLIDPTNYPTLGKTIEDLTKAVELLNTKLSESEKPTAEEELKLSIKARDDQINALKKKVEVLEKSDDKPKELKEEKGEPQTVSDSEEPKKLETYNPIKFKNGEIYFDDSS